MAKDINTFLVEESNRVMYDIYRRKQYSSPWISLPRKVAWPEGMGSTFDNIMWERPRITGTENDWERIDFSTTNVNNACIPPVDDIEFDQTLRRTMLFHKAVHSPKLCVTDLLMTASREKQIKNVEWGLGDMIRLYWIKWNRDGFKKNARKVIINASLPETDESDGYLFPQEAPTSKLTNGVLDYFYGLLILEQASEHALSSQGGRPVFGLITDQFTSRSLTKGDSSVREDFRYGKPDMLFLPPGISHTYNGYIHMIDDAPERWSFNASAASDSASDPSASDFTDAWELVPHYLNGEVNPAWLTAEVQDSYIYVKEAYQLRVPRSIAGVSQAKYDPQKFMGEVTWRNVVNMDKDSAEYNPDGKIGRYRAVMTAGVEPINPHVMFVLRHKVCDATSALGLEDCASV